MPIFAKFFFSSRSISLLMVLNSFVIRQKALYSGGKESNNNTDNSNFQLLTRVHCTLAGDPLESHVETTQHIVFISVANCLCRA